MGSVIDEVNCYLPVGRLANESTKTYLILLLPCRRDCLRLYLRNGEDFREVNSLRNQTRLIIWIDPLI